MRELAIRFFAELLRRSSGFLQRLRFEVGDINSTLDEEVLDALDGAGDATPSIDILDFPVENKEAKELLSALISCTGRVGYTRDAGVLGEPLLELGDAAGAKDSDMKESVEWRNSPCLSRWLPYSDKKLFLQSCARDANVDTQSISVLPYLQQQHTEHEQNSQFLPNPVRHRHPVRPRGVGQCHQSSLEDAARKLVHYNAVMTAMVENCQRNAAFAQQNPRREGRDRKR